MRKIFPLLMLIFTALLVIPQNPTEHVGKLSDGGFLLTTGWRIAPEGIQVPLPDDTLPLNLVMHPDGKSLFVVNSGYLPPSVVILNTANLKDAARIFRKDSDAWLGLALNKTGDRIYVPEATLGSVQEFSYISGVVKPLRSFQLFPAPERNKDGKLVKSHASKTDYLGDATVSADGKWLFVANMQNSLVHAIDLQNGDVSRKWPTGKHPYKLLATAGKLYTSNWGEESVTIIDPATGKQAITFKTGGHPTDMLLSGGKLYVACANTNSVFVHEADTGIVRERINIALHPQSPPGSTPNALAISPDARRLYVANADNNAVAVVDLPERGTTEPSKVVGFIPTGWYPTALAISGDGRRLYIANGKGERSYPNSPDALAATPVHEGSGRPSYVGTLQKGSISVVEIPQGDQLKVLTERVVANSPYRDELLQKAQGSSVVVPTKLGDPSPVQHVIYVIKENRTYDQVLGDMKEGNGDPKLAVFPEEITPNHHKLAREFVLLDNFYVNADVSADGHAWSMGAIASDFTAKLWPAGYGGRRSHYDSEGEDETGTAGGGWLFNSAVKAGLSFRTYGEWVHNGVRDTDPVASNDKTLTAAMFDPKYHGFDTAYSDQRRIDEWTAEFREYEKNGNLPRLEIVRIGNDHTSGTRPGAPTPRANVADNDLALGRLVETLSKSRYWKDTVIFVLEDDAQSGPDHVDSHRSPGFVISSWTRKGKTDSTMYSTVSMLRTMGLILGFQPMSQYDAGAMPMHSVFLDKPDLRPYELAAAKVDLKEVNTPAAPMAKESAALDFSEADRVDDALMNRIIWAAMKGDQPMPAPTRSVFPAMWIARVRP